MKRLKINRYNGVGQCSKEDWKELISALVMVGYEVYADDDNIVFTLGIEDNVKEVE